jgi:hypothetical protein
MRRLLIPLACVAIVLGAAFSCTPPQNYGGTNGPPNSPALNMVQEDNFDGSALNTNLWQTGWYGSGITGPVGEDETACYDPTHVVVGFNVLSLIGNDDSGTTHCPKTSSDPNPDRPIRSGNVWTYQKYTQSHGYVEVKALLACAANGKIANWPAIWLVGEGSLRGEIDIVEGLDGIAEATYHDTGMSGGTGQHSFGNYSAVEAADSTNLYGQADDATVCGEWHTFGVEWRSDRVISYYDGQSVGSFVSSTLISPDPMVLIIGNQYSPEGHYGGPVVADTVMYADWARWYQYS